MKLSQCHGLLKILQLLLEGVEVFLHTGKSGKAEDDFSVSVTNPKDHEVSEFI